jgi:hypothetical protein
MQLIQSILVRKLVIIGDGACGKTSLLSVFTLGYFPTVSRASLRAGSGLIFKFVAICKLAETLPSAFCDSLTPAYRFLPCLKTM